MSLTIADVARALEREQDPERRLRLEQLALAMLQVSMERWRTARFRSVLCRRAAVLRSTGGGAGGRDRAAA